MQVDLQLPNACSNCSDCR